MKIPLTPPPLAGGGSPGPAGASPQGLILDSLALRDGQATLARVLEQLPPDSTASRALARLTVEVGGQSVAVDSRIKLEPGTLVRLQRIGNELRLLENLGAPSPGPLNQALARKLPAQLDIQTGLKLIAGLGQVLAEPASGRDTAAGPVPATDPGGETGRLRSALAQVLQVLPRQAELERGSPPEADASDPSRIRQWLRDSGLFTEARLAGAVDDQGPADLKSQLLRLAVQLLKTDVATAAGDLRQLRPVVSPDLMQQALQFPLTPVPSNRSALREPLNAGVLLRIIAGMINRITVNQLHSQLLSGTATADGGAPPQTWLLELPWLNPQQEPKVLQVRLERHEVEEHSQETPASGRGRTAQWRLNLALDLDAMGPLYFELALTQDNLATRIWAEQESTWRLVADNAGQLRRSLGALGIGIKSLECRHGQPPRPRTRLAHGLVDERA